MVPKWLTDMEDAEFVNRALGLKPKRKIKIGKPSKDDEETEKVPAGPGRYLDRSMREPRK